MKFKYILMVSLILAILTLGAVSASQDDGNLTAAEDVQDSLSVDEDIADSSDIIADDGSQDVLGDGERKDVDEYNVTAPSSTVIGEKTKIGMRIKADNATGNFTFSLNNKTFYDAPVEKDDANNDYSHYLYLNVLDLKWGINNFTFKYTGDDKYTPVSVDFKIHAYEEVDTYYTRVPNRARFGDSNTVVGLRFKADNPTGNFTFILNNQIVYNAPIAYDESSGYYSKIMGVDELDLQAGMNNITFIYTGDDRYASIKEDYSFEGYYFKAFTLPKSIIYYGDKTSHWTVEVSDPTGYACVLIDGEVYLNDTIANLTRDYGTTDYLFRITFFNCPYGNHTYNITYYNGKYDDVTFNGTFTYDYYFVYDYPIHLTYPDPIPLSFSLPKDVTGNLTVTVKDKNYTVYIENGEGVLNYNYTNPDVYSFIATFENEKYPKRVLNITVPIEATVKMQDSAYYGDKDVVSLVLPADATGNLTIYKRNGDGSQGDMIATKALVDGKVSFDSTIFAMGNNDIIFNYTGDDYAVKYAYPQIKIYPKLIYAEKVNNQEKNNITVVSSDDAIGNLTIEVYNAWWDTLLMTLYNGPAKGQVSVELPYLKSGDYGLKFKYDDEYQPVPLYKSKYFSVGTSDYNWTMDVDFPQQIAKYTFLIPSDGYFRITNIPENFTGDFILYVDGKKMREYEIEDYIYDVYDRMTFDLSSLSLGNHTWRVKLSYSSYYVAQPVNGTFEVIPYDFPETIEYDDGDYKLSFDLSNKSAKAILYILIDGKDYKAVQLKDGKAEVILNDLPLGKHTYELVCAGDVNKNYTGSFDVKMGFIGVSESFAYYYGRLNNVKVGLPKSANGFVTLIAKDKEYTSEIENGIAKFDLSKLDVGNYLLIAKYPGDDINPAQEVTFNLTIKGYFIEAVYTEDYSRLLGFSIVLPSNATGNLSIYDNNNSSLIKSIPLVDGKAFFSVEDELNFGVYDLTARYESDNHDYAADDRQRSFAYFPLVNITQPHIGDNTTVEVFFKNATGNVTVLLNKEEYANLTIQDGKISLSIPFSDLKTDTMYNFISFVYHGTDFDPAAFNSGSEPKLFAIFTQYDDVVIPTTIANGEVAYATAELPANAEGYVILSIQGNGITSTFNMTFAQTDKVSVAIPVLPAGRYWISFRYYDTYHDVSYGNGRYVYVLNPEPTLDVVSPTGTNVPVLIFNLLPSDVTGSIIVSVDGKNYGRDLVNGSVNITIPGLDNGDYSVKVVYSGDDNYVGFDKTVNVTVDANQYDPKVVASDLSMIYTAGKTYQATIWGANGKLASNVDVTFLINGKVFKTVKTNAAGVASVKLTQVPGSYKIAVKALGVSVTKKLTVKHVLTLKKVKVKRSAKKLVIKATLSKVNGKYLKNKKITFKFKGKKYTAKTNSKGVAKVTIKKSVLKKLKAGKKVTYTATYLKDTVKKTVKVKK